MAVAEGGVAPGAGCGRRPVTTRRNRQTGTKVTVARSAELGLDADNAGENDWWTLCVDHAFLVSHPTRKLAERHAADPMGWCEYCNGQLPEEV